MRILDASSILHAWDNYPLVQFPMLWKWLEKQIGQKRLSIASVAFEEVKRKSPECAEWLVEMEVARVAVRNEILAAALQIQKLLGIRDDQYHSDGVDENDVLIIATAKVEGFELVSNESRQLKSPKSNNRLKIPAVCNIPSVGVQCIDFVELIKQSGEVF